MSSIVGLRNMNAFLIRTTDLAHTSLLQALAPKSPENRQHPPYQGSFPRLHQLPLTHRSRAMMVLKSAATGAPTVSANGVNTAVTATSCR